MDMRHPVPRGPRRMCALFPECRHAKRALAAAYEAGGPDAFPGAVIDLLQHLQVRDLQRLLELPSLGARLEATLAELDARLALAGDQPELLH